MSEFNNPIELVWKQMKIIFKKNSYLREARPILELLIEAAESITSDNIRAFFRHCGYLNAAYKQVRLPSCLGIPGLLEVGSNLVNHKSPLPRGKGSYYSRQNMCVNSGRHLLLEVVKINNESIYSKH